jgi:hypothetical protein
VHTLKAVRASHACNPSFRVDEAVVFQVQGQPGLHSKKLSENKNLKTNQKKKTLPYK